MTGILALLLLCDASMPFSPGAFHFELGQSLEVDWPVSVHRASSGQAMPLPHRFPNRAEPVPSATAHPAPIVRRDVPYPTPAITVHAQKNDLEAPASEDPLSLPV